MRKLLLLALPALFLFSCKKNSDTQFESGPQNHTDTTLSVYKYIKKLGYRDNEIKDLGKDYLVDGDILFAKNSKPDFSIFSGPQSEQYGLANYVGYNNQTNITIRIDPSMNAYVNEINGAIAMWNNVINCRINFVTTTATNQNILITNEDLGPGYCGASYCPINGQPGGIVRININQIAGNTFLQRQRTIAHELGHSIGFKHTNWQPIGDPQSGTFGNGAYYDAQHILGTPTGTDVNSLMNGNECGTGATALSNFDILAVQFLYPENAPVAGTVPVFRYFARTTWQDHFYTTNLAELGNGANNNYIFEGIAFFAFPNQVNGSVPVYRSYKVADGDHFYTTNYQEASTNPNYKLEGIVFYAYPSALNGSSPVQRYYSGLYGDHFYTKNANEVSTLPSSGTYNYEITSFYAY